MRISYKCPKCNWTGIPEFPEDAFYKISMKTIADSANESHIKAVNELSRLPFKMQCPNCGHDAEKINEENES